VRRYSERACEVDNTAHCQPYNIGTPTGPTAIYLLRPAGQRVGVNQHVGLWSFHQLCSNYLYLAYCRSSQTVSASCLGLRVTAS